MSTEHLVPEDLRNLYHVREWRNATGVLATACPNEWTDIIEVLRAFRLLRSEILTAGGGLSPISQQINAAFDGRGWKNKDPFFDRDLNNFRLLFDLRAIDVGVIITRATELHGLFDELGKTYVTSTTHHEKLWPRIEGGGGGGCPVLTFAITRKVYVDDGQGDS